ncbi:MAG: hypothetical protein E7812_01155 [Phenylobacterium sp.]|nr:MAG: hypothetical protein E7812_01155 [Phenylobacterium sp.]
MKFVTPTAVELAGLRADPLIFEQELDVRPEVAASLERALGFRAGRAYWRSAQGHLFAIELGDFGRGRPSMAIVSAFWPRYEPRPLDDTAIDDELELFLLWMAEVCDGLDPEDLKWTLARTPRHRARQG